MNYFKKFTLLLVITGLLLPQGLNSKVSVSWRPCAGIPVLCYHRIVFNKAKGLYEISEGAFYRQMKWLKSQGYETIELKKFYSYIRGEKVKLPPRPILITFDDGNRDFAIRAKIILSMFDYKAVLFIYPTVITRKRWAMTWEELREAAGEGHEIQSHTYYHPRMDFLRAYQQKNQLIKSRQIIQRKIKTRVKFLAYPFGSFNRFSKEALVQSGYLAAFTVFPGSNIPETDPYFLNRYMVLSIHTLKDFKNQVKYRSLPVYSLGPPQGSYIYKDQKIRVNLPTGLDKKNFIIYSGESFIRHNNRQRFYYNGKNGHLVIPVLGIKKNLLVVTIRYKEGKNIYMNKFLYIKARSKLFLK